MGGKGSHGGGKQQLHRTLSTMEKSTSASSIGDEINLCGCGMRLLMQTSTQEQSYGSLLGGGLYVREEEAVGICVGGLKGVILGAALNGAGGLKGVIPGAALNGAGGLQEGVILADICILELNGPMAI
ncbi:hypothetical protein CRG98_000552 [Punica granatum]|uniref:Uncharacterized protein n=1 Tax=Punica granatum TaxID=22663 RepID=A0A2I0LEG8_PUNGR|nr:hypothetical protein CRG98_000552 [Punica granatum]